MLFSHVLADPFRQEWDCLHLIFELLAWLVRETYPNKTSSQLNISILFSS